MLGDTGVSPVPRERRGNATRTATMAKTLNRKKIGTEAHKVKLSVRQHVLHEAGYKCANPRCRYPLTLDIHHLFYVSEGGADCPDNLVAVCPTCHREHHQGIIATDSLRAWKMLLLALNEAFDRRSVDILLTVGQLNRIEWITGDGLPAYAPLTASGLLQLTKVPHLTQGGGRGCTYQNLYEAQLTDKGRLFLDAWKKGDQRAAIEQIPVEPSDSPSGAVPSISRMITPESK
jgi:hypothetical protein